MTDALFALADTLSDSMLFDQFWELYPRTRRGNKQNAYRAWMRACERDEPEVIMAGLRAYVESEPGIYAKGCAAWLNDDRWNWTYEKPQRDKSIQKSRYFELKARFKKPYNDFMSEFEIKEMRELEAML